MTMKIFRLFPLVVGLLTLGLTSCNEDIEYDGDFKETAIVFGLLDQADSVHYIKITRAFGGGNNSLEVAQIADSSYFQNIYVVVDEVIGGAVTRSWTLDDTILENKAPGVFYNPDQKVYYFTTTDANPLVTNATYKLRATVNNGEFIVYGGTSEVLDVRIKIFFDEYRAGVPTEKSFTWKLGELNGSQINAGNTPFYANGQIFYELIRDNCTNDPTIDDRQLSRIQIITTGGADDLNKYILLNKPSSGLAQNKPTFTNITTSDGRRAIGLFSARSTVVQEKPEWVNALPYYRAIDNNSTKELCTGPITGSYLFCSDHPSDIAAAVSYICN